MSDVQLEDVARFCNRYPDITLNYVAPPAAAAGEQVIRSCFCFFEWVQAWGLVTTSAPLAGSMCCLLDLDFVNSKNCSKTQLMDL